jgi:hypothetical protein
VAKPRLSHRIGPARYRSSAPFQPNTKAGATEAQVKDDALIPPALQAGKQAGARPGRGHEIKIDGYRMQLRIADGNAVMRTREGLDCPRTSAGILSTEKSGVGPQLARRHTFCRCNGCKFPEDQQKASDSLRFEDDALVAAQNISSRNIFAIAVKARRDQELTAATYQRARLFIEI